MDTQVTPAGQADAVVGKRALVIGAGGFLGRHLLVKLDELGVETVAVSRTPDKHSALPAVRWERCDASSADQVEAAFKAARPHFVWHLTSDSRGGRGMELIDDSVKNDIAATLNALQAASRHGVERIILAGSFEEPDGDARAAIPSSPYAAAKWVTAGYARMFAALYGLPVSVLRLMMTYGPGQKDYKVIPYTIQALLKGETAQLSGGTRAVDWVHVDDVTRAFILAATRPWAGAGSIDIGSGRLTSLRDCLSIIGDITGRSDLLAFGSLENRAMEREYLPDLRPAEAALGWRPEITLEEGLSRTVDWYRERMEAPRTSVRPSRKWLGGLGLALPDLTLSIQNGLSFAM